MSCGPNNALPIVTEDCTGWPIRWVRSALSSNPAQDKYDPQIVFLSSGVTLCLLIMVITFKPDIGLIAYIGKYHNKKVMTNIKSEYKNNYRSLSNQTEGYYQII